jgi:hypothetical protein
VVTGAAAVLVSVSGAAARSAGVPAVSPADTLSEAGAEVLSAGAEVSVPLPEVLSAGAEVSVPPVLSADAGVSVPPVLSAGAGVSVPLPEVLSAAAAEELPSPPEDRLLPALSDDETADGCSASAAIAVTGQTHSTSAANAAAAARTPFLPILLAPVSFISIPAFHSFVGLSNRLDCSLFFNELHTAVLCRRKDPVVSGRRF